MFSDGSAELIMLNYYDGDDIVNTTNALLGTYLLRSGSYKANNGNPYIIIDVYVDAYLMGDEYGSYDGSGTLIVRYFINTQIVRIQIESNQYLYCNLTDNTPTHIEIPDEP